MKLIYYGHSACLLETSGYRLLVDPFLTDNPLATVAAKDIECNYILLTHGHSDHVGDTLSIARRTGATVIACFELAVYLEGKGLQVHPMHIGGQFHFPFGRVKFTIAHHGAGLMGKDGTIIYTGNPAGLLIQAEEKTVYHAGDTGLFYDMKLIGERDVIDLALLPIGDNFTMGIEDACKAAEYLKPKRIVPIHYNTFPVIEVNVEEFVQKCAYPVHVLGPGQSILA